MPCDERVAALAEGVARHVSSRGYLLLLNPGLIVGGFFAPSLGWIVFFEILGSACSP